MAAQCNTKSKILAGVGVVLGVVAVILLIIAQVAGNKAADIDWVIEGKTSATYHVKDASSNPLFSLYYAQSEKNNCKDHLNRTTVTDPRGQSVVLWDECSAYSNNEQHLKDHDPPLYTLATFFSPTDAQGVHISGNYQIDSSTKIWMMDALQELGEAVTGIFAMLGLFVGALIIGIVGCVLCCVACCCMDQNPPNSGQPAPALAPVATVVGEPAK